MELGGIGTYVKRERREPTTRPATAPTMPCASTRRDLRCQGGRRRCANLGLTQRGAHRVRPAGAARINTDFIDNSAGVDCSDHEVNLKILQGEIERAGDLTRKQRNELLEEMTEDVAELVLRDNYLQTQCLTVTQQMGVRLLDRLGRFMRSLEKKGRLDRRLEFLPDDEELLERANRGIGLTRPELSVLLSYAKMELYDELLGSDLPDDACLRTDLATYFPHQIRERFAGPIERHRLRREIVATVVTNEIVNRVGINFVQEVREKSGLPSEDTARGYLATRDVFGMRDLWRAIEAQDHAMPALMQAALLAECGRLLEHGTVWFLRVAGQGMDVAAQTAAYADGVRELAVVLPDVLSADQRRALQLRTDGFIQKGAPAELAAMVARLAFLAPALDIVHLAAETGLPVVAVARTYFSVGSSFGFNWLRSAASLLPSESAWDKLAITALVEELDAQQAELTGDIVEGAHAADGSGAALPEAASEVADGGDDGDGNGRPVADPEAAIHAWAARRRPLVARTEQLLTELQSLPSLDLAMLAVASRQLKAMST